MSDAIDSHIARLVGISIGMDPDIGPEAASAFAGLHADLLAKLTALVPADPDLLRDGNVLRHLEDHLTTVVLRRYPHYRRKFILRLYRIEGVAAPPRES